MYEMDKIKDFVMDHAVEIGLGIGGVIVGSMMDSGDSYHTHTVYIKEKKKKKKKNRKF